MKQINEKLPISLKYLENLVDRVYIRYPVVDKFLIIKVIKTFFESIRDTVIAGNYLSLNGLFANMHIMCFSKYRKNKNINYTKIKLSTPKSLKK